MIQPMLRALVFALLLAAPAAFAQSAAVPKFSRLDSMEARAQGCTTCHGQQGQGTANAEFPRIAGKPAGYLFNQLKAFRDGTRRYPAMNYLVAFLTDDYLREMAEYFAALRPPFDPPVTNGASAAAMQLGRSLVAAGDPNRQVPACMACHGPNLTGMEPGIPGLVGLKPNYIAAQLTRWRTGDRQALAPDCMQRIASRLRDEDITAVSAWLGSLAAPQDASPEIRNLQRMPMACGSQR